MMSDPEILMGLAAFASSLGAVMFIAGLIMLNDGLVFVGGVLLLLGVAATLQLLEVK